MSRHVALSSPPASVPARRRCAVGLTTLSLAVAGVVAASPALAADPTVTSVIIPGTHGYELGCAADWDIDCPQLVLDPATGLFTGTFDVPAGTYEYWTAVGTSDGTQTYRGKGGVVGGEHYAYVSDGGPVTFTFDPATLVATTSAPEPAPEPAPVTTVLTGLPTGDLALTRDEASGKFRGTTDVPAGTYTVRVGGASDTLTHGGGPLTFVYDPATEGVVNSAEGIFTIAGTWNLERTSASGADPRPKGDDLTQLLTDPDGDGVYTLTLDSVPTGPSLVSVTRNLPRFVQDPQAEKLFTSTAGNPVTFTYVASTGALTVDPAAPGLYDPHDDRAVWVDADTIAYPHELVADGGPDEFRLVWTDQPAFGSTWEYWNNNGLFTALFWDTDMGGLTERELTAAELAGRPELAGRVALDLYPNAGQNSAWPVVETWRETGQLAIVRQASMPQGPGKFLSVVGAAPYVPAPVTPQPEPTDPGSMVGVVLTSDNRAATAREFGLPVPDGAVVVSGDWDGDGTDTLGWRVGNRITFASSNVAGGGTLTGMWYGKPSDEMVVGDWNGDGVDTVGMRRGNVFHLRDDLAGGNATVTYAYGRADDEIAVGDFDGDGKDTVSVRRGNGFHINNALRGGNAQRVIWYGKPGEHFLIGDLDGDGKDAIIIHRGNEFHLMYSLASGNASKVVKLGGAHDTGLLGDWDGNGTDTIGVVR